MSVNPSPPNQVIIQEDLKIVKVVKNDYQVIVSREGFQGIAGPQGPQGQAGSNTTTRFADLEDVLLVNLANDNIIKWNSALQVFLNQESVDGGSF